MPVILTSKYSTKPSSLLAPRFQENQYVCCYTEDVRLTTSVQQPCINRTTSHTLCEHSGEQCRQRPPIFDTPSMSCLKGDYFEIPWVFQVRHRDQNVTTCGYCTEGLEDMAGRRLHNRDLLWQSLLWEI